MFDIFVLLSAGLRRGAQAPRRFSSPDTDIASTRFAVERSRYATSETNFRTKIQKLYSDMTGGDIGIAEFYQTFSKDLYDYQVKMYILGRRAIGREDARLSDEERKKLHGMHSSEMKYFNGFIRDWLKGSGKMPYPERLDLYALGGYEVYLQGALNAVPFADQMRFKWVLNEEAEHCDSCLWKHEESVRRGGFTLDELTKEIGLPGTRCKCLHRCRCHIQLPDAIKQLPRTRPTAFKSIKRKLNHAIAKKPETLVPERTGTAEPGGRKPESRRRSDTGDELGKGRKRKRATKF